MAQLALLSHVAMLKQKEFEKDTPKKDQPAAGPKRTGKQLNTTNEEAYALIAGGILG